MKILQYLFLLVLLAFFGVAVFIMTQDGSFDVSSSQLIQVPKTTAFDYVNDYRNWETFGSWNKKDSGIRYNYPAKTMGVGGYCSWNIDSEVGLLKTNQVIEGSSIVQQFEFNGTTAKINWSFKDTVGGVKISVHTKGTVNLYTKITSFFKGGISTLLQDVCSKSLTNLHKTLVYEMKTYSIKVNGVSQRNSGYCLKQTYTFTLKSLPRNIKIIMPRMVHFFKQNKLVMNGKPFVYYDMYDTVRGLVTFSICVPTTQQIYVSPGSDITSGEIVPFTCVKSTLIGDYSHTQEVWKQARKYISDNGYSENSAGKYTEVYVKTLEDIKQPSKWVTEIYIPVFPKVAETTSVVTNSQPETSLGDTLDSTKLTD